MSLFDFGASNLARVTNGKTRSISAENPDGAKGGGAKEIPEGGPAEWLGKGWKVHAYDPLPANSTKVIADVDGPGTIRHIWITTDDKAYRDCLLRIYWDNEETPSVDVPLGDFFAQGHGVRYNVNSQMICVNPNGGMNSYWPMPFRKHMKIEIVNQRWEDIWAFFWQVDYELDDVPEDAAYFHAQWRRAITPIDCPEHVILDGIKGKGHYVGTFLAWTQLANGWWGEGEIKFFMDGDQEYPTICGTGTEDYFGGAWCFGDTYSTPYLGYPLWSKKEGEVPKHGLYRWHVLDPVRFDSDLRVTIQALGWWPNSKYQQLQDDIASTAYWYQLEPHARFPEMLEPKLRWPR
jgi:hypothetical protein